MADKEFEHHGIDLSGLKLNLEIMLGRKQKVVDDLTKGIEFLIKKNKIAYFVGFGKIAEQGKVSVSPSNGKKNQVLETENIMIATGSQVTPLPGETNGY